MQLTVAFDPPRPPSSAQLVPIQTSSSTPLEAPCSGFCTACETVHHLGWGTARERAYELMGELERHQRLDLDLPAEEANPVLSFDSLFSDGGGCMLGVLECRKPSGERVVLKAFSSLKGGIRTVEGWVPHLLGEEFFLNRVQPEQQRIKALSSEMELQEARSEVWIRLREDRKRLSQQLMEEIHTTYRLVNFRGQTSTLKEAFHADHGMGGKVGQCCAPKLLVHAARSGLHPTGIAEFHWGGNEHAGDRQQGVFYPACRENCQPILGFLLCGLESGSDE